MEQQVQMRRRVVMGRVAALVATGVLALGGQQAASAAPQKDPGGPARVVIPVSSGNVPGDFLTSGTAATKWTLALPQGASCSGDTATDNYHIFTYVVPSSVDPATLHFGSSGPSNNPQAFPLVDDGGSPFIAGNTGIGTGQVLPVPFTTLQWGNPPTPFDSTLIPPGTYNIGIACANGTGDNDKFWNAQETFTGDPTVFSGTNAFAWTVVGGSTDVTSTTSTTPGETTTSTTPGETTTSTTLGETTTSTTIDPSVTTTSSTSTTVVGETTTTNDQSSGSGGSSAGDSSSSSGGLALTGASVMKVGGLGIVLFVVGWGIDRAADRRRRPQRREL